MGSTGSGSFGNYRVGNNGDSEVVCKGEGSGTTGGTGKGTGEIECPKKITNISLEDVATSEYYMQHRALPVAGEAIHLRNKVHNGRLVVEKKDTKEILGNLPTQYNYLINCIKDVHYSGVVISADNTPIPFIVVTLNA